MNSNVLFCKIFFCLAAQSIASQSKESCSSHLKYLYGDALTDDPDCIGPNGLAYPKEFIARTFTNKDWPNNYLQSNRRGRLMSQQTLDPRIVQKTLLNNYLTANEQELNFRTAKAAMKNENNCPTPARLCKTRYNTTAPMYGVSLTSGQPVTIVQKFPDLLQQVVFEVCESSECDVVRGECTQTYVPYLFLVIPLGPVTLTGQDYVLVESGCTCRPKYSNSNPPSPISALPTT
ncbi:UNVERIFIED_CONTAM: hypothetical protein PYX00_008882 [Menopon gallinae]|uniref:Spaetzle domain-containing protein n=1 Tax=Menopon gallinae TaxID=328185 RepID=A0AAW2H990_9NEOP